MKWPRTDGLLTAHVSTCVDCWMDRSIRRAVPDIETMDWTSQQVRMLPPWAKIPYTPLMDAFPVPAGLAKGWWQRIKARMVDR